MLDEIRTSTITSKGQIVIPCSLREREGFHAGQKVAVFAFGDRLEVVPVRQVMGQLNLEAERKRSRAVLSEFGKKHGLKGRKARKLSAKARDQLAKGLL